jgi:hypothetical protein
MPVDKGKGRIKVKKLTDPHLTSRLVEKETDRGNLRTYQPEVNELKTGKSRAKYVGKTRKNLHRDLIGFARTKRRSRYEIFQTGGVDPPTTTITTTAKPGVAPTIQQGKPTKPQKLIESDVTNKERFQVMTRSLGQATGVSKVGAYIKSATGRVGAYFDFNNPEASQIVEIEIAGRNFINTALAYKAYLLKIREALMVIDKKILTPIIVGSIKGKKGGALFNDGQGGMFHDSTVKYLYRLANLRHNTYIDYIGKCSMSSLSGTQNRLKLVVDFFKRASGNLRPFDRYNGMRYRFFMCKLYKLREAELEFNYRLQQLTQGLKFISNLPAYQTLQKFIKIKRTEFNQIEIVDIKATNAAFTGYDKYIIESMRSQKLNAEAVDFQDSVLSKAYYKTLQNVPANIERVKWTVNKCMVIAYEIDALQDEIHSSTGFAPNPELNFVLRSGATKRLKDNAARMIYYEKINDINLRVDSYVQYLLQSIDTAVNYGNEENPSGAGKYQEIVDIRETILFLDAELNKITTYQSADIQKIQGQIRLVLQAKMAQQINVGHQYYPNSAEFTITTSSMRKDAIKNISTKISQTTKTSLFKNAGVLFDIWATETKLTEKLWDSNNVMTRSDLQQILGAIRDHYSAKLQVLGGKPIEMQSNESMAQFAKEVTNTKLNLRLAQKGGGDLDVAEFNPEPNESYPQSMSILPFGYPADVLDASAKINQCGGDISQREKKDVLVQIYDKNNPNSAGITERFPCIKISKETLGTFYGDLMYILNTPLFFESHGFFQKLGDFFTRASKTQKTKEIHRLYMNYIIKFDMGVLNFDDTNQDGLTPSRFPTGTAFSGYPAFVMMKLYWQYLDLTEFTNYSDLAFINLQKLAIVRKSKQFVKNTPAYTYTKTDNPAGYNRMVGFFGEAATSNHGRSDIACIPPSFLQIGLLNQDEVKAILSEDSLEVVKDIFKSAVYKLVNERINRIRQDDAFIEQMRKVGKLYIIRVLKPEVYDILGRWQKAIDASQDSEQIKAMTDLKAYLTETEKQKLESYINSLKTNSPYAVTNFNISVYKTDDLLLNSKFNESAVNDYTKDFRAMAESYTGGFRILYVVSLTMAGKKYRYYDPEQMIDDYQQGVSIPELIKIPDNEKRRVDFNKYDEDHKNIILGMVRAQFSMLRGADYNDTYFPLDKDGNLDTGYIKTNNLVYNEKKKSFQISAKKVSGLQAFFSIIFLQLPKLCINLGIRVINIIPVLLLLPILIPVILYLDENSTTTSPAVPARAPASGTLLAPNLSKSVWDTIGEYLQKFKNTIQKFDIWGGKIFSWTTLFTLGLNIITKITWEFLKLLLKLILLFIYIIPKLYKSQNWSDLFNLGEKIRNKTPEELKRLDGTNTTKLNNFGLWLKAQTLTPGWNEFLYRNYTLDQAEFAMATMYLYEMAPPTVSTSTPSAPAPSAPAPAPSAHAPSAPDPNSATEELGKIICKYFAVYYEKDATNLDGFKKFINGMQTAPTTTSGLPDEDKTTLHDLVKDLVGKTDTHTSAVFGEFVNNIDDWQDFKLDKIYNVKPTPPSTPPTQSKLQSINVPDEVLRKIFMKKYTSSTAIDLSQYYADTRPDAQLSLLMQVIKLSGCVRLVCCLHIIYKQYKFLQQKIGQMSQMNKGLSKDLATDAVDDLFRKLTSNAYNAGYFGDIKLFMDACGVKVIQYYKTKITELISADRLELTGTTDKLSVQSVFNRTLTKLLMFLRLNLIFTDYIQFKKRIVRNPQVVNGLQNNSRTWEDVFELEPYDHAATKPHANITYTYVLFTEAVFDNTNPTEIKLTSIYPTFDTIIGNLKDSKKPEYFKFTIPSTNIKYYSIDSNIYDSAVTPFKTGNIDNINVIVCPDSGTGTSPTKYIFFVKTREMNLVSHPKYNLTTSPHDTEIKGFYNSITEPFKLSVIPATPPTLKHNLSASASTDVNILAPGADELYYVHPLYPRQPIIDSALKDGSPETPVYYYPVTEEIEGYPKKGNPTHKHFETKLDYYVSMFPTFTKLEKLTTATPALRDIQLPEKIDLAGLATTATPPEPWTFSDFVWVQKDSNTAQTGGSAFGDINQTGGADPFGDIYRQAEKLNKQGADIASILNAIENIKLTTQPINQQTYNDEKKTEYINAGNNVILTYVEFYRLITTNKDLTSEQLKKITQIIEKINTSYSNLLSKDVHKTTFLYNIAIANKLGKSTLDEYKKTFNLNDFPVFSSDEQHTDWKFVYTNKEKTGTYDKLKTLLVEKIAEKKQNESQLALPSNVGGAPGNNTSSTTTTHEEPKPNNIYTLLQIFLPTVNIYKTEFFGDDVDLQQILTKLDEISAALANKVTEEALNAKLTEFVETLTRTINTSEFTTLKDVIIADIAQKFATLTTALEGKLDSKFVELNTTLDRKITELSQAHVAQFESLKTELLKQNDASKVLIDSASEELKTATQELKAASEALKAEKAAQQPAANITRLHDKIAGLEKKLDDAIKAQSDFLKESKGKLTAAEVVKILGAARENRGNTKNIAKTGPQTQTQNVTVQPTDFTPLLEIFKQMQETSAKSAETATAALNAAQNTIAAAAANNTATNALKESITALTASITAMKSDTTALDRIITIEKEHRDEIKALMEQHVNELKASQDKLTTEVAKVQKEAKGERMATNKRNRKEREDENDKRREHELMILSLAKEEREKILSEMLAAKQTGDSELLTKFTKLNESNNLVITQLIELLKAQGVSGAQMVQLSMVPAAQSQLASFGMGQQPQYAQTQPQQQQAQQVQPQQAQQVQPQQAQQVQPQQAQQVQPQQAALQVTGQGVQAAASASTTKKIPKYNFTVMPTATTPTLSQKINIVDTVDKLFTEVEALFVTAATGAAAAAPPSLTSNKYYFVIGYETPASGTPTATQLKYEFTTIIDLTKHTSESIRCIYAVSGEEKGPITINFMQLDTRLNTTIANHTGTHINNYITKSTIP